MWVWPERPDSPAGRTLGRVELDLDDIRAIDRDCDALRWISPLLHRPLVPIRSGGGARLGVAVSYLKFTTQSTWNPF